MSKQAYFDYAAATPMDKAVLKVMQPYFEDNFYNPSASYLAAKNVRDDIDRARADIARTIGAKPSEIVFTSGATEANNLAISGVRGLFGDSQILTTALEHDSVREPSVKAGAEFVKVTPGGLIDLEDLKKSITKDVILISLMLVNNELGTLQPVREVAELIDAERKERLRSGNKLPIYLHTDAAQAANYYDLHVSRLGVDLMSVNGGKIYGPKQTGFLYVRAGVKLAPQIVGGGQEFGLRSGTENVAGVIGLAAAFMAAQAGRQSESARLSQIRVQLEKQLLNFKAVQINGLKNHRAPHITNVSFDGYDNERLMMELDERGLVVATGSACSAGKDELSHVLSAIGLEEDLIKSTLRLSIGRNTTEPDLESLINALKQIVK